mmetsp:Transcript_74762/g.197043  ORF Transcript_74762/g.197043 Transcript_74762/m.197043 type:complete len:85 (+) Transcript_74762:51-305(+)
MELRSSLAVRESWCDEDMPTSGWSDQVADCAAKSARTTDECDGVLAAFKESWCDKDMPITVHGGPSDKVADGAVHGANTTDEWN